MKKEIKIVFYLLAVVFFFTLCIGPALGEMEMNCVYGVQEDQSADSLYQICMPPEGLYNGRFIIWAHGFQDADELVGIPAGQLTFDNVYFPELVVRLGFGFATNSYRKTGLAVKEGKEDILDLVSNLKDYSIDPNCKTDDCEPLVPVPPEVVYIIGASEGGLITTLLVEENPEIFDGGYALCGPIGNFRHEINYLGDARVTFEYFYPGLIPGTMFEYPEWLNEKWADYYKDNLSDKILSPAKRSKLLQWLRVAKLPYDMANFEATVNQSAEDVLRYAVVNAHEAKEELGGFPYDNRWKWYSGSKNDFRLNLKVKRFRADTSAVVEMKDNYNTSGELEIPLITMHTKHDQQVPYWHEIFYILKTIKKGSFLKDHFNIPIHRYGHCNFTLEEALGGFAMMLLYAGDWEMLTALETFMQAQQLEF